MTCKCGNPMAREHDRYRCHICGTSIWHQFTMRPGDPGRSTKGLTMMRAIKGYGKGI